LPEGDLDFDTWYQKVEKLNKVESVYTKK